MTKNKEIKVAIFETTEGDIFYIALFGGITIEGMIEEFVSRAVYLIHSERDNKEPYLKSTDIKELGKVLSLLDKKVISISDFPSDVIESIEYFAKYNEMETSVFVGIYLHRVISLYFIEVFKDL